MRPVQVLALLMVLGLSPARLGACTLWAAIGDVAGGGTLLSKNRDWRPDHRQSLKVVHPSQGLAYCGLFAEDGEDPGLKAGVNEKGLSIVSASTNVPKQAKDHQPGKHGVMAQILADYATVEALAADADAVFSRARTSFYMVSDRKQVLLVEVGLEGRFSARLVASGTAAHTNHFLDPGLAVACSGRIGDSSARRLARVQELLGQSRRPFDLARFITISRDRNDGPDNSLWRSGKEWTLA
ncbi:MAG TPA: carcinine hydrolase/isopenicillin-N N-acyltransferase family protein, partial [Holophaga sp.]|nr:carcinine hydrolase/isopenicillin-N N-acyltransferase family protein [Holophaga sp.]